MTALYWVFKGEIINLMERYYDKTPTKNDES